MKQLKKIVTLSEKGIISDLSKRDLLNQFCEVENKVNEIIDYLDEQAEKIEELEKEVKLSDFKKIKVEKDETLVIQVGDDCCIYTKRMLDDIQRILKCKILVVPDFDDLRIIKTIK